MTKPGGRQTRRTTRTGGSATTPPDEETIQSSASGTGNGRFHHHHPRRPVRISQPEVDTDSILFTITGLHPDRNYLYSVIDPSGQIVGAEGDLEQDEGVAEINISEQMATQPSGRYEFQVLGDDQESDDVALATGNPRVLGEFPFEYVGSPDVISPTPAATVRLDRAAAVPTPDEVLSSLVLGNTTQRSFARYDAFVSPLVCRSRASGAFTPNAYQVLVESTREFLAGPQVPIVDQLRSFLQNGTLPYLDDIAKRFPDAVNTGDFCSDLDANLFDQPFPVELIWSYWHEEGGLVQTLNHILARFQNRRISSTSEPLARFDLSPLRPLRSILFSWADDEINRLTVRRRDAEYANEYGIHLIGRAIPPTDLYVEQRTQFLESFHTLLFEAHRFFVADDDATMNADAFPVLNSLRDTHLVLAEGAVNQYGDLPTVAREQMLIMQWLLRQPEMRDFLGGRPMMPYREPWMDRVDTMKTLCGWSPTSITYFNEMAVIGEQLLLTIRFGNWNDPLLSSESAKNWARTWRNGIQRYVHAYRSATGVDLTSGVNATLPAVLLGRRTPTQARRA